MKERLSLVIGALLAIGLASGCGPDAELVASGKAHACAMQALEAQLEASPGDADLLAQLEDKSGLLQAVIETADPGDQADLQAAIQQAVAEGCD